MNSNLASALPYRPLQKSADAAALYTVDYTGDSMGYNPTKKLRPEQLPPAVLEINLQTLVTNNVKTPCLTQVRNWARSGDKSPQILNRLAQMTFWEVPDIFIIEAGVNDYLAQSITGITSVGTLATATTALAHNLTTGQLVTVAGAGDAKYNVTATVTVLTSTTFTYVIVSTGNVAAAGTLTFSIPTTGTQANIESMIITLKAAQVAKGKTIRGMVVGAPYLNFSGAYTAGAQRDTLATPYTQWVDLRAKQALAAANQGVAFCDEYTYTRNLIANATPFEGVTYVEGDALFHYADGDIHPSVPGARMKGAAMQAALAAAGFISFMQVP